MIPLLPGALLALALAAPVPAQRLGGQWTLLARERGILFSGFGWAVAGAGDLDLDGHPDLLIGAPDESNTGAVYAYSGANGRRLWKRTGPGNCARGTAVAGPGDLNGDGRPDVLFGAPGNDYWYTCGAVTALLHDGRVWWTVQGEADLGVSVAGTGDVDRDGYADVIAGASQASPGGLYWAGAAYVYSGRNGTVLYAYENLRASGERFGWAVGGTGDVNADGWPDFIVGAPWARRGGLLSTGAVYVYSGRDGSQLHELIGGVNEEFGRPVTGAGDLDGDGRSDLLVGAVVAGNSGFASGSVYVYSGATGSLLYRLDGAGERVAFGTAIDDLEDVDLDGVRDVAVGATGYPPILGSVSIYSGANGALLDSFSGTGTGFGWSLADAGDVDLDGFPDLIVGFPDSGAYLYSFDPFVRAAATEISAGSGLIVPVRIDFPLDEASKNYALLFSDAGIGPTTIGGIEVPLGAGPLLSSMLGGWSLPNVQGAFGTLDAKAAARARIASDPWLAALVGRSFHMAAVSYEAATLQARRTSIAWPLEVVL